MRIREKDDVAKLFRVHRHARGLTQEQVRLRMGLTKDSGSLTAWETGRVFPNLVNLIGWAEALDCDLEVTLTQRTRP